MKKMKLGQLKNRLTDRLTEAKYLVSPEDVDKIDDKVEDDDIVKVVDMDESAVNEKSESKAQQRFMGMVYACKKTGDCASEEVRKAAEGMSLEDAEDFASTKHKGLPEKVDEMDDDFESADRMSKYGIDPEVGEEEYLEKEKIRALVNKELEMDDEAPEVTEEVNVQDMAKDVQKFLDKLNLGQFEHILAKIDKPAEKAEVIAAFAERIGVPRGRLSAVLANVRGAVEESVNPRIKKEELSKLVKNYKK